MRTGAEFSYAQARIQARHSERLADDDWRRLDGAQTIGHFLDRARATALKRFLMQVGAGMDAHAIERALLREARGYIGEVADWAPARWRPTLRWLGALPLLVQIDEGDSARVAAAGWHEGWRARWPDSAEALAHFSAQARRALASADGRAAAASPAGRPALARVFLRHFRSSGATPLALLGHLGLVLIDIERLRGGLVRRSLFNPDEGKEAA